MGNFGQLATGDKEVHTIPMFAKSLFGKKIKKVSCAPTFSCFLTEEGRPFTCGEGTMAALGQGNTKTFSNARPVKEADSNTRFVDVQCGWGHAILLGEDGNVYSMGLNIKGQCGVGDKKKRLALTKVSILAPKRSTADNIGKFNNPHDNSNSDYYNSNNNNLAIRSPINNGSQKNNNDSTNTKRSQYQLLKNKTELMIQQQSDQQNNRKSLTPEKNEDNDINNNSSEKDHSNRQAYTANKKEGREQAELALEEEEEEEEELVAPKIIQIATGLFFSAVLTDRGVFVWGNFNGKEILEPKLLTFFNEYKVISIWCGNQKLFCLVAI